MWTIIFFTSWQCSPFVMGNDDWLSHLSDEIQLKCEKAPLGQYDILDLADVPPTPPPLIGKVEASSINFRCTPSSNGKVEISGQSDILVLADVPPPLPEC